MRKLRSAVTAVMPRACSAAARAVRVSPLPRTATGGPVPTTSRRAIPQAFPAASLSLGGHSGGLLLHFRSLSMAPGQGGQPPSSWVHPDNVPTGEALKKYGRDLTALAKAGKLDPVIGREEEMRRAIQILSRRTKNNPVFVGEVCNALQWAAFRPARTPLEREQPGDLFQTHDSVFCPWPVCRLASGRPRLQRVLPCGSWREMFPRAFATNPLLRWTLGRWLRGPSFAASSKSA